MEALSSHETRMNLKAVAISFDLSLFVHFFYSYADSIAWNIQFEYLMAAENAER